MGRDLTQAHGRLERIESDLGDDSPSSKPAPSSNEISGLRSAYHNLQEECHNLRMKLHQEKLMRKQQLSQIDQHLSQMAQQPASFSGTQAYTPVAEADELAAQMAARIDGPPRQTHRPHPPRPKLLLARDHPRPRKRPVRANLDYTLEQIEQRFEKRLRKEGHHFVHVLQPLLEGCLLIQSPPAPK